MEMKIIISLILGLLTVDPKKRLTMENLKNNDWLLRNNNSVFSEKTLKTPGILTSTNTTVQLQLTATMDAFHKATREGFRLQDVNKAPLARRRKQKKASDERSESSDSSQSNGSGKQGSQGATPTTRAVTPTSLIITAQETSTLVRNLSNNSNMSNASSASHSSTHSLGFVPQRTTQVDFVSSQNSNTGVSTQDMFVIDSDQNSASQGIPFKELRDSSESETSVDNPPFQASRGVKRKHSLEEEDDDFLDSDEDDEDEDEDYIDELGNNSDCIIIDEDATSDSLSDNKSVSDSQSEGKRSRTNECQKKKPRTDTSVTDPIIIDD